LPNVISMISFRGTLSKLSPTNPLTRGFTPGPHWVLRPQTHSHYGAWGKRREGKRGEGVSECPNPELLSSLAFVQKFKFILMKMHKKLLRQSCSFWLRYAPNRLSARPKPNWGSLQRSPRPHSWFRGGPPGKGKEGGRGGEDRGGSPGMPESRVGKPIAAAAV